MAWDHLTITNSHLVYIILGGFTSLFMLCSSVIKERMYIGEATVATICGLIFGPHAANLIDPNSWGNVDEVTIEFSRIVLVVQCFAVGVELPKFYMEKHWKSVVFLLVPVMTFGWLVTSLFIWWMVPALNWLESLCVAACVTATDPVLASSVVGKGKFAKRVPKHLRDLLSAESGCNDGMAFPFIYLALYLIQDHLSASEVTYHWIVYTILYECIFGAFYGFMIGYIARHGIKLAEKYDLIDRESFLVFYFTLALFCAGSGSILGVDDLLVGFAAGVGFSNDGWFTQKTEESHVSNVIDLLLNLAYFVYLGTIIPWEQFNNVEMGLSAWKLTIIAIFVILFRRIPIMMALKPFIPDIKTWREALFAGHFGPIGVGAIFVAIMARAELEGESPIPLSELPSPDVENYTLLTLVWPIVTFLVVASIIVHGSSVAVFTLGKHINTLSITMSYTQANEDGPSWMNRLPRISSVSRSQARTMSDTSVDDLKLPDYPPGTLPPVGYPGQFLRRQKEEDNPSRAGSRTSSVVGSRRKRKMWDDGIGPGGPVSQSAIFPQRRSNGDPLSPLSPTQSEFGLPSEKQDIPPSQEDDSPVASTHMASEKDPEKSEDSSKTEGPGSKHEGVPEVEIYDEGGQIIIEDQEGSVLAVEPSNEEEGNDIVPDLGALAQKAKQEIPKSGWTYDGLKKKFGEWRDEEIQKRKDKGKAERKHEPARAYQFGNTIIVEDEDGEVVKKYELPSQKPEGQGNDMMATSLKYMGMGGLIKPGTKTESSKDANEAGTGAEASPPRPGIVPRPTFSNWTGFGKGGAGESSGRPRKKSIVADADEDEGEEDRQIRFTIGGTGRRMTTEDFLKEVQKLDPRARKEFLEQAQQAKSPAKQSPRVGESSKQTPISKAKAAVAESEDVRAESSRSPARSPAAPVQEATPRRGRSATAASEASSDTPETAVERKRRLAALSSIRDDDDVNETPTERRRREAALGVGGSAVQESDSDDDDTPRVPPTRQAITFARGRGVDDDDDDDDDDDVEETPAERRRREAALGMGSPTAGNSDSEDDDTPRVPAARRGIRFADAPPRGRT